MYVGRQAPDFNPFKTIKKRKALKGKVSSLLRQQDLEEIKKGEYQR
jgi:hypothetical protein